MRGSSLIQELNLSQMCYKYNHLVRPLSGLLLGEDITIIPNFVARFSFLSICYDFFRGNASVTQLHVHMRMYTAACLWTLPIHMNIWSTFASIMNKLRISKTILPFPNTSAPTGLRLPVPHVSTKPLKSSLQRSFFTPETSELSTVKGIIMK